jgi:hypothetical protein
MGAGLVALGACSDGGDGGGPPTTLAGYDAEFAELAEDAAGLAPTDPAMLPTSGAAGYEGVIRIEAPSETAAPQRMSGTLDLAVDFGSGGITGEAGDFVTYSNGVDEEVVMEGSLAVTGDVTRDPSAGDGMLADIDGVLAIETDPNMEDEGEYRIDGTLGGEFLGEDAEVIQGNVSGTVQTLNAPTDPRPIGGDFVVER